MACGQVVLHVQQVRIGQLDEAQQPAQADICHRARRPLRLNIAESHDADNALQGIQVCVSHLCRLREIDSELPSCLSDRMHPLQRCQQQAAWHQWSNVHERLNRY